jgi:hypothetical protein
MRTHSMSFLRGTTWVERVKRVEEFHQRHLDEDKNWSIPKTADLLCRSVGGVCEDLMLASYLKTHPVIEKFQYIKDALEYCRKKKYQVRYRRRD